MNLVDKIQEILEERRGVGFVWFQLVLEKTRIETYKLTLVSYGPQKKAWGGGLYSEKDTVTLLNTNTGNRLNESQFIDLLWNNPDVYQESNDKLRLTTELIRALS